MKGFMTKALAVACAAGGLTSVGCFTGEHYRNLVDPCYPGRYGAEARREVAAAFAPQVQNGHILDQTIWNWHFESGTAKLTAGGMDKLDQLVRRRPEPDPRLFIATARDIQFNAEEPDKYGDARRDLDGARVAAIQKYLAAQTVGRPFPFEVLVHDPADPGIHSASAVRAVIGQRGAYTGSITGGSVGGSAVTTGGVTGATTGNVQGAQGGAQGGNQPGSGGPSGSSGMGTDAPPRQ